MIERKKDVAEKVVGTGEGWLTELSTTEPKELFALQKEAVARYDTPWISNASVARAGFGGPRPP